MLRFNERLRVRAEEPTVVFTLSHYTHAIPRPVKGMWLDPDRSVVVQMAHHLRPNELDLLNRIASQSRQQSADELGRLVHMMRRYINERLTKDGLQEEVVNDGEDS